MNIDTIRSGQVRPYADTVDAYQITGATRDEIIEHYQLNTERERPGYRHDGSCNFPFGLESFWTLTETGEGFKLSITRPYCG